MILLSLKSLTGARPKILLQVIRRVEQVVARILITGCISRAIEAGFALAI
jgi:hypothetical protein